MVRTNHSAGERLRGNSGAAVAGKLAAAKSAENRRGFGGTLHGRRHVAGNQFCPDRGAENSTWRRLGVARFGGHVESLSSARVESQGRSTEHGDGERGCFPLESDRSTSRGRKRRGDDD